MVRQTTSTINYVRNILIVRAVVKNVFLLKREIPKFHDWLIKNWGFDTCLVCCKSNCIYFIRINNKYKYKFTTPSRFFANNFLSQISEWREVAYLWLKWFWFYSENKHNIRAISSARATRVPEQIRKFFWWDLQWNEFHYYHHLV